MQTLFYNPNTKIIFASDDAQDSSIQTLTASEVAPLVADGATVDSSAEPLITASEADTATGEATASASSSPSVADTSASSTAATAASTDTTASAASEGEAGESTVSTGSTPATSDTATSPVAVAAVPTAAQPATTVALSTPAANDDLSASTDGQATASPVTGVPVVVAPATLIGSVDENQQSVPAAGVPPASTTAVPAVAIAGDQTVAAVPAATTPGEIHLYFERIKKEIEGFGLALEESEHRFFDELKAKILG